MCHFSCIFILFWLTSFIFAQAEEPIQQIYQKRFYGNQKIPQKMPVLVRNYPVYLGNGQFRIYFPVEVQFNFFQFLYNDSNYVASGEVELNITSIEKGDLRSKVFKIKAIAGKYTDTNRPDRFQSSIDSLDLPEGVYDVKFRYHDLNSEGRQMSYQFKIELPHVKNFYTSPMLFINPIKKSAAGSSRFYLQPSPLIEYWDFNTPLGIQLCAWYSQPDSPLKISLSVLNVADPQIHFLKDTLLTVQKRKKSLSILLPSQLLPEGKYQINVKYEIDGHIYDQIAPLGIVWFDKPFSLWNLSTTIGPMKYLMDEQDYKYLTKGGKEAQLKKFSAYWKEQDTTPDTPFNELQNEFYTRVDSAIIKFGGRGLSGWKTDIGRIYILYGAPDEIEDRSLAPVERPYLRWTYYIDDIQMKVTFYAIDGRRNYKLANIEEIPLQ